MADRIRIWITRRLLGAAWIILPRWHPAYRGIFDAAVAIRDGSTPTSGVAVAAKTGDEAQQARNGGCDA